MSLEPYDPDVTFLERYATTLLVVLVVAAAAVFLRGTIGPLFTGLAAGIR